MNRYLNTEERGMLLKLGAFETLLMAMIDYYARSKKTDKEFLKYLRMMRSLSDKTLRTRMQFMDTLEIKKLVEQVHKHHVVVRPIDVVKREQTEIDKLNSRTIIENDDFLNLAEWTIEYTCKQCTNTGCEVDECGLRVLWVKYDIAPLDAEAVDQCPYQYADRQPGQVGAVGEAILKAMGEG